MSSRSIDSLKSTHRVRSREATTSSLSFSAITCWATIGVILMAFEAGTTVTWVLGPNFRATDTGGDPISQVTLSYYLYLQIGIAAAAAAGVWYWILGPWLKFKELQTDGMLAIACWTLVFYDCSMNYLSPTVLYNSHFFNRGSWTAGSWWSWVSPNGNLLPEPLSVTGPGYLCLVFSQILGVSWLIQKAKSRWPTMGVTITVGAIIVGMTLADSLVEVLLLRTGVYAYPAGIRSVTLFAGHTYQFPLTEGFTFGGLGVGAITALRCFKNDRGETWAERGVRSLSLGRSGTQLVRFLAIYGFCHLFFIAFFTIPNQWLALHSGPFPEGYPSYMINGLCAYGPKADQCPGPGVPLFRL